MKITGKNDSNSHDGDVNKDDHINNYQWQQRLLRCQNDSNIIDNYYSDDDGLFYVQHVDDDNDHDNNNNANIDNDDNKDDNVDNEVDVDAFSRFFHSRWLTANQRMKPRRLVSREKKSPPAPILKFAKKSPDLFFSEKSEPVVF